MQKVHSHYDNLKVARNAPVEVIRAAYRTLSQKYHPDRNPGDAEAERIMRLVNQAYGVLSDEVLRRQHDLWIEQQEAARHKAYLATLASQAAVAGVNGRGDSQANSASMAMESPSSQVSLASFLAIPLGVLGHLYRHRLAYCLFGLAGYLFMTLP